MRVLRDLKFFVDFGREVKLFFSKYKVKSEFIFVKISGNVEKSFWLKSNDASNLSSSKDKGRIFNFVFLRFKL